MNDMTIPPMKIQLEDMIHVLRSYNAEMIKPEEAHLRDDIANEIARIVQKHYSDLELHARLELIGRRM